MALLGTLLFVLLFIGCWCPYEISADSCVPTVRGEPFIQFVKNKNCDVDEKLLKLFNPESFNESVANNKIGNFMCVGFMSALTMAPEDFWLFDPLEKIPDSDFCSDTKMMTALGRIVNGSVFDSDSNIVVVSNSTIFYCKTICEDYNELCWAFGTVARIVLLHSSVPTTAPTASTETTSDPTPVTTEAVHLPAISNSKGADSPNDDATPPPQPADHTSDQPPSDVPDTRNNDSETSHAIDTSFESDENLDNDNTGDRQHTHSSPNTDTNSLDVINNATMISVSISQNTTNITTTTTNTTATNITTTTTNTTTTTTTTPENITTTTTTNTTASEEVSKVMPGDNQYEDYNFENNVDQNGDDDSDHNDDVNLGGTDQIDDDDDDDDDDDGYSYWHFAAILLFILFLGVAGYLASHNRKKVQ